MITIVHNNLYQNKYDQSIEDRYNPIRRDNTSERKLT